MRGQRDRVVMPWGQRLLGWVVGITVDRHENPRAALHPVWRVLLEGLAQGSFERGSRGATEATLRLARKGPNPTTWTSPPKLDEAFHKAFIEVDENGTEAAAATAIVAALGAGAPVDEPVDVVVDRPFLFVVRDRATGAILFMGRVTDPR